MDPENFQAMRNIARPQSWNGYSYVNNNPLRSVDPSGLAEQGGDLLEILRNGLSYGYWMTDAELHAPAVAARTQVAVEFGISDPESGLVRGIDLSRKSDGEALLIRDQFSKAARRRQDSSI